MPAEDVKALRAEIDALERIIGESKKESTDDSVEKTIAQDQASSAVYGMPKEAVKRGAVERILPLGALGREIMAQMMGLAAQ